jgi:hypothetical protein
MLSGPSSLTSIRNTHGGVIGRTVDTRMDPGLQEVEKGVEAAARSPPGSTRKPTRWARRGRARVPRLEDVWSSHLKGGVMPAKVLLFNLIVLAVLLEADLGRRKIGWFRVLRPLIASVAAIALFTTSVPTSGHNLALEAAGVGAGVLAGLAAHLFVTVGFDPAREKQGGQGTSGRAVSWAGFGYATFWVVIFAARLVFIYGTQHWFSHSLGQFLTAHQLSPAALTDALLYMAIAMALARSALLAFRGRAATRHAADGRGYPAAVLSQDSTAR